MTEAGSTQEPSIEDDRASVSPPIGDALELAPGLSPFDRALIRALQEDGRRSYASIAADLKVHERAVRARVHELRANGVIEITAVADPGLMGYGMTALLGVRVDPRQRLSAVARSLAKLSGAFYVIVVTGRYNVLVELSCVDADHLLAVIDDEIPEVSGVTSVEILPYLRLHYQNPAFEAANHKGRPTDTDGRVQISFEDVDREIIRRLHDDGRTPFQAMARELGISESQVRARVRRMIASQAVRIMALTVPRSVGFETVALIGIGVSPGADIEGVANALAQLPSIIYVAISAGRFEILAEAVCTNREALFALLNHEIRRVQGIVDAEPWIYLQLHYRSVQPAP